MSFRHDGPLDMRMGDSGPTAADVVNGADERVLADIIYRYGEEPASRRIARAIVAARPLNTTSELASVVRRALGFHPGMPRDPATRTFQALRIHVNDELGELDRGLAAAERLLRPGGRLAVVSFHSLEDRAVKRFLTARGGAAPGGSRHLPEAHPRAPSFERPAKAVRPSDAEIARNPRARSATLRAATRTAAQAWGEAA
jgi:16S rRNA (cytosine1402-N4)-methyltransferase